MSVTLKSGLGAPASTHSMPESSQSSRTSSSSVHVEPSLPVKVEAAVAPRIPGSLPQVPPSSILVKAGAERPRIIATKKVDSFNAFLSFVRNKFSYVGLDAKRKAVMKRIYDFVEDSTRPKDPDVAFGLLSQKLLKECPLADIQTVIATEHDLLVDALGTNAMIEELILALYKNDGTGRDERWLTTIAEIVVGADVIIKAAREYAPSDFREKTVKIKPWIDHLNCFFQIACQHRLYNNLKAILGSDERTAAVLAQHATKAAEADHKAVSWALVGTNDAIRCGQGLYGGKTIQQELTSATALYVKAAFFAKNVAQQSLVISMIQSFQQIKLPLFINFVEANLAALQALVAEASEGIVKVFGAPFLATLQAAIDLQKCSVAEQQLIMLVIDGVSHNNLDIVELDFASVKPHLQLVKRFLLPKDAAKVDYMIQENGAVDMREFSALEAIIQDPQGCDCGALEERVETNSNGFISGQAAVSIAVVKGFRWIVQAVGIEVSEHLLPERIYRLILLRAQNNLAQTELDKPIEKLLKTHFGNKDFASLFVQHQREYKALQGWDEGKEWILQMLQPNGAHATQNPTRAE